MGTSIEKGWRSFSSSLRAPRDPPGFDPNFARALAVPAPLPASPELSHDLWIGPSSFPPAVGSELAVSLKVGEHFRGDPVPLIVPGSSWLRAVRFRVLYEGKPLAASTLALRSGADGRVSFRLPRRGVWLVKVVHMVPAPNGTGADWESLWASLTFEVP